MPGKRLDESKRECVRKLHDYFQKELANGGPLLPLNAIQEVNVKVSIYYESLCPDSKNFIKNQLYPTYTELGKDVVDVDFVPYGHASETNKTGDWVFTCQHGPRECLGNGYHSCALALNSDEDATTNFIHCSMSARDPSSLSVLEECSHSSGISWEAISDCYNSGRYVNLLIQNGARTRAVEDTSFIPTVVLNDKFDDDNQTAALSDLKKLICDTLNNEPDVCNQQDIEVVMI